jgi:excisionase family DNA binding protein
MRQSEREVLSVAEAAEFLGISERTMRRLIAERRVPFARVGGSLRLRRTALLDWLAIAERQAHPAAVDMDEAPAVEQERDREVEEKRERTARVRAIAGKYAHVPFSSRDLMREKQLELEQENRRWHSDQSRD